MKQIFWRILNIAIRILLLLSGHLLYALSIYSFLKCSPRKQSPITIAMADIESIIMSRSLLISMISYFTLIEF